ncbi:hypothetical protein Anapl_00768 [Anas platyrhynchos]|uniref:Uncharacterized protein n=1 Tax=Anas platyrhynchos TaxID=8839 RepID=R0L4F0_ANAPL|nr:hypothetical protein Anapl_00768 [Anas platyrhynchos]
MPTQYLQLSGASPTASCESANILPLYCLWRATRREGFCLCAEPVLAYEAYLTSKGQLCFVPSMKSRAELLQMHSRPAVTQVTTWNKAERNPAHETVIANGWGTDKLILKAITTVAHGYQQDAGSPRPLCCITTWGDAITRVRTQPKHLVTILRNPSQLLKKEIGISPKEEFDALSRGKGYVMNEVCLQSLLLQDFAKKRLSRECLTTALNYMYRIIGGWTCHPNDKLMEGAPEQFHKNTLPVDRSSLLGFGGRLEQNWGANNVSGSFMEALGRNDADQQQHPARQSKQSPLDLVLPMSTRREVKFLQREENSADKRANCRTGKAESLSLTCWEGDAKIPLQICASVPVSGLQARSSRAHILHIQKWGVTGVGGALHGSSEVVLTMVTLSNISTSGFNHGTQIGAALQDWIGNQHTEKKSHSCLLDFRSVMAMDFSAGELQNKSDLGRATTIPDTVPFVINTPFMGKGRLQGTQLLTTLEFQSALLEQIHSEALVCQSHTRPHGTGNKAAATAHATQKKGQSPFQHFWTRWGEGNKTLPPPSITPQLNLIMRNSPGCSWEGFLAQEMRAEVKNTLWFPSVLVLSAWYSPDSADTNCQPDCFINCQKKGSDVAASDVFGRAMFCLNTPVRHRVRGTAKTRFQSTKQKRAVDLGSILGMSDKRFKLQCLDLFTSFYNIRVTVLAAADTSF